MRRKARILPTPGYVYTAPIERIIPQLERIIPSSDYKPMTMHARALQASGAVKRMSKLSGVPYVWAGTSANGLYRESLCGTATTAETNGEQKEYHNDSCGIS